MEVFYKKEQASGALVLLSGKLIQTVISSLYLNSERQRSWVQSPVLENKQNKKLLETCKMCVGKGSYCVNDYLRNSCLLLLQESRWDDISDFFEVLLDFSSSKFWEKSARTPPLVTVFEIIVSLLWNSAQPGLLLAAGCG